MKPSTSSNNPQLSSNPGNVPIGTSPQVALQMGPVSDQTASPAGPSSAGGDPTTTAKVGSKQPMRTTKFNQKLVVFPSDGTQPDDDSNLIMASPVDENAPVATDNLASFDEVKMLGQGVTSSHANQGGQELKRVTSYCTSNSYDLVRLKEFVQYFDLTREFGGVANGMKRVDEVLIVPYAPSHMNGGRSLFSISNLKSFLRYEERINSSTNSFIRATSEGSGGQAVRKDSTTKRGMYNLLNGDGSNSSTNSLEHLIPPAKNEVTLASDVVTDIIPADAFPGHSVNATNMGSGSVGPQNPEHLILCFDYGVVVFWGLSELEERVALSVIHQGFSLEPLKSIEDWEIETLQYCFDPKGRSQIFNDIITLSSHHEMVKLSISHAIAQSVKLTYFEELVEDTITSTQVIPRQMARSGSVPLSRKGINRKIGELFFIRIQINLVSNVLDTPEIFWAEPRFVSVYKTARLYLEINQRVDLLNQRTGVIGDLLDMLKDHLTSRQSEILEWIIIVLILIEIVIGILMIILEARNVSKNSH